MSLQHKKKENKITQLHPVYWQRYSQTKSSNWALKCRAYVEQIE
jgi:hypothetical protein